MADVFLVKCQLWCAINGTQKKNCVGVSRIIANAFGVRVKVQINEEVEITGNLAILHP